MILSAAAFVSLSLSSRQHLQPVQFVDGLAIGGVIAGGRLPVFFDSIQGKLLAGQVGLPKEGETSPTASGGTAKWRKVFAGKDGTFTGLGNGYLAASMESRETQVMLLEAAGDSLVYVNGAPRAGDPYSNGYLKLPVLIYKGQNAFLFVVGRGQLKASLSVPKGSVQIDTGDLTTPDIVVGGQRELTAGVVVLNNTSMRQTVRISSKNAQDMGLSTEAVIPALTLRKVPVKLTVPSGELGKEQIFKIEVGDGKFTDHSAITIQVKKPTETHKETFISQIDGSVQYYGVNPSQKPSKTNALVLSLHGASVEGIGQAAAYSNKDWCTLVAPTNRRPYGFDWEDVGRLDALEVLSIAKKRFVHDPASVHLTGHSMGGHGTWSIGTLYPDLFSTIAPSAGWISFWSYAGGYQAKNPKPVESLMLRAMSPSDTLARVENTLQQKTYILHGDADDNVPVEQAREMKKVLTDIHADFDYHEQPGAGHWWGLPNNGSACVDWPGIFDQIKSTKLLARTQFSFTTPSPGVSAHDEWLTILQQVHSMETSKVKVNGNQLMTVNVAAIQVDHGFESLSIDGQDLGKVAVGTQFVLDGNRWKKANLDAGAKSPDLYGPFKNVYRNRFVFVVGTHGSVEENIWAANKARFDAESFQYRGNGAVDVVTDREYRDSWQRNVVLYGNQETNSAWKQLLGNAPILVARHSIKVGSRILVGDNLASIFVFPHLARDKWILVGAISGTGVEGMRLTDRLPIFTSGVAFPDWTVMSTEVLKSGAKGVKGCGFFGNDWTLEKGDSAWNQ